MILLADIALKTCTKCKEERPVEQFHRDVSTPDGLRRHCRLCVAAYDKELKRRRREAYTGDVPSYKRCYMCKKEKHSDLFSRDMTSKDGLQASCKACHAERAAKRRARYSDAEKRDSKEQSRRWQLQTRYGISLEQYQEMYIRQDGVCAICRDPARESARKSLCVDHDHKTGRVRELLCDSCNAGIGFLNDSPDLLEKSIQYLRKWSDG